MTAPTTSKPARRLPKDQRPPYEPSAKVRQTVRIIARLESIDNHQINRPSSGLHGYTVGLRQMCARWIAAESGSYATGMTIREARVWLNTQIGKPVVISTIPGPGDKTGFRASATLQYLIDDAGDEFSRSITHITKVSTYGKLLELVKFEAKGAVPPNAMNAWADAWLTEAIVDSFMAQFKIL